MATVNDPIVYATNYYTLLNVFKRAWQFTEIMNTPTPIAATP